ncbi:MAG: divalent-cation tolerance protein CutA [Bacteroidota bacterium]
MSFILIYITHPDENEAQKVANVLVLEKYVACSNIFPIKSAYWWNNVIENDQEWVSIVKTIPENWEAVKSKVSEIHSYEVPCILKIDVDANEAYEKWIKDSVDLKT